MMGSRSKTKLVAAAHPNSSKDGSFSNVNKGLEISLSRRDHNLDSRMEFFKGKALGFPRSKNNTSSRTHCVCRKEDDGTPMVLCNECRIWYHFRCIGLHEEDAEELCVYICPHCIELSGRRTAMLWEGSDAIEAVENMGWEADKSFEILDSVELIASESEEDPSSTDEYYGEIPERKRTHATHHNSSSSESDSTLPGNSKRLRHRTQKYPTPTESGFKRECRASTTPPPTKRKKAEISNVDDDPTRKYCLGKFEELFSNIFYRCFHLHSGPQSVEDGDKKLSEEAMDELLLPDKDVLSDKAMQFARELEKSVFEVYSESDRNGFPSAGSKYKDRFRMLQFNLSKPDRVLLHKRIVSALITPYEISLMSSTELANEETKKSIMNAEKEALEHSILTPTAVPRAKITHKGLEDIEDIHGDLRNVQLEESTRLEEEGRRDRERIARLRAQGKQRAASTSMPPDSPHGTPEEVTAWESAPGPTSYGETIPKSSIVLSFSSPVAGSPPIDFLVSEPDLDLAEFINIDDVPAVIHSPASPTASNTLVTAPAMDSQNESHVLPATVPPLAGKEETVRTSFDLDALWSKPNLEQSISVPQQRYPVKHLPLASSIAQIKAEELPASDSLVTSDHDFDVFLDDKDSPAQSIEGQQAVLDALPHVWVGKITMPLDSTIPQESLVFARQIGGRQILRDSELWKTLFPTELLRIDGRVPVNDSSKFLLQMRLNYTKELIAVAFSPASDASDIGFRILSDFLIAKGRHGLVFPWGTRPKDYQPGRELYVIPLLSSDPLPDYMEVLENLRLPKLRKTNLLVGIWILNKGKLMPPPPPPPPPALVMPSMTQNIQSLISNVSQQSMTSVAPPPPPLPTNIATEVANLTPEQVRSMIHTLTRNGPLSVPFPIPQQVPPHVPAVHQAVPVQPFPSAEPSHQWLAHIPDYGPINSPLSDPYGPFQHSRPSRHDFSDSSSTQRPDYGGPRVRPDREERNSRRWRGRGTWSRPSGNESPRKPVDSGWPRRSRPNSVTAEPSSPSRS